MPLPSTAWLAQALPDLHAPQTGGPAVRPARDLRRVTRPGAAELRGLEALPTSSPAPLSSRRMKAFNDRSQPSIRAMFAPRKRPAGAVTPARTSPSWARVRQISCVD